MTWYSHNDDVDDSDDDDDDNNVDDNNNVHWPSVNFNIYIMIIKYLQC